VDKDIDIFDERQVLWALATRVQGDRDIITIPGALGSDIDPSSAGDGVQCKVIIDATAKPSLAKFPVKNKVPDEVFARIQLKDFIK
jgi:3-polyprenyl-4-hydroxybenzoate decarboxylase